MERSGISVIGVSHHAAPLDVRERLALDEPSSRMALRAFHREPVIEEAMILSTCNRTEVYFVPQPGEDAEAYLLESIARIKGRPDAIDPSGLYRYDGLDAVRHLFRVTAALDSQIVGEHEIIGQVRQAYHLAVDERTAGFFLNRLLHWAFRVGKRVRSETHLGRGSISIPQAAVDLAGQALGDLAGRGAMLLGAGRMGELSARALLNKGVAELIVANRDPGRAKILAEKLSAGPDNTAKSGASDITDEDGRVRCPAVLRRRTGGHNRRDSSPAPPAATRRAIGLDDIASTLEEVDLVICATDAGKYVLRSEELSDRINRRERALVIVDIAVPRNVDPRLGELSGVHLYDLDALDKIVSDNIARRRSERPPAEAIVEQEMLSFAGWMDSLQARGTIRLLQRRFEKLRGEELGKHSRRFSTAERAKLEPFAQGLCNKILHHPIAFLRNPPAGSTYSDQLAAVDMIRRMFDLDDLEAEE